MNDAQVKTAPAGADQRSFLIRVCVFASLVLLVTGAVTPLLTTERFYFFSNTFSLASGLRQLVANDQALIAAVVILFSFCIPVTKAVIIWLAASRTASQTRLLAIADRFGKWSMLEVFIAALLLVALKLGPVVDTTLHYGAWLLAASVLLSGIASQLLSHEPQGRAIFSGPETLTLGAIGGAIAATALIGLLNPDLFRFEALLGTPEERCISRVLRLDGMFAAASASEADYATNLAGIEAAGCPDEFSEAFDDYISAWQTLGTFSDGDDAEPSLLERAGARLGLIATRDTTLEDIEEAWSEIVRVASEFGIEAPTK
jgi:paraquat-inducible protein A